MMRRKSVACFCAVLCLLGGGCLGWQKSEYALHTSVALELLPLGNHYSFIPVSVFVERYGAQDILANYNGEIKGTAYVMGIATLIVKNDGTLPVRLAPWHDAARWRIVIEYQDGDMRSFALSPSKFRCREDADSMVLEPGDATSFLIGLDNCGPYKTWLGKGYACPWPVGKMHIEYGSGRIVCRSNELRIRCLEHGGE